MRRIENRASLGKGLEVFLDRSGEGSNFFGDELLFSWATSRHLGKTRDVRHSHQYHLLSVHLASSALVCLLQPPITSVTRHMLLHLVKDCV